jgi:hypothetical protein
MYIASCGLSLLTYQALNNQIFAFGIVTVSQLLLAQAVYRLFSAGVTDLLMTLLNLLACVLMPLDQLDKVLATKDASYVSIPMNLLNAIACFVWGWYYLRVGAF